MNATSHDINAATEEDLNNDLQSTETNSDELSNKIWESKTLIDANKTHLDEIEQMNTLRDL